MLQQKDLRRFIVANILLFSGLGILGYGISLLIKGEYGSTSLLLAFGGIGWFLAGTFLMPKSIGK